MKLESYSIGAPVKGVCKQYAVWGLESNVTSPIIYLQRPDWIKDDKIWETLVKSIKLDLPIGFEIR